MVGIELSPSEMYSKRDLTPRHHAKHRQDKRIRPVTSRDVKIEVLTHWKRQEEIVRGELNECACVTMGFEHLNNDGKRALGAFNYACATPRLGTGLGVRTVGSHT
jgi:hypothetical protein